MGRWFAGLVGAAGGFLMVTSLGGAAADEPVLGHFTYGNGAEKVLVLHDWMGNARNYDALVPHLDGRTFTYVFADLRGYGASRAIAGEHTVVEAALDAFRLADSLGWERFHLIGHSMSGMIVQRMAIDDWTSGRKRLKSVVGITPVPASGVALDAELTGFVTAVVHNPELTAQYAAAVTGGHATAAFAATMAARQIDENDADAMQGYRLMWTGTDFAIEAEAAKVGTPMLVIGGRLDLPFYSEEAFGQTFAKWYPNVGFRYIADAGHYLPIETPAFLAALIEEFLRANS